MLPGIDDGAENVSVSLALIQKQMSQGVRHIVATPHFRKHIMSVDDFLERRQAAYEEVMQHAFPGMPPIYLSAEIALEHNLCEMKGIERLACVEMNTLLLEMPFSGSFGKWMVEEIEEIGYRTRMQIVIAHIDRYVGLFSDSELADILSIPDMIFQVNLSAFSERKPKKLLKRLINDEYPILFGTDCHNLSSRKPNFDVMAKPLRKYEPNPRVERLLQGC